MKRLASALLLLLSLSGTAVAQTTAVVGGTVHTAGPRGTLENATVLIRDGRIAAVGTNVRVPAGANVIDADGKIVTPGLFTPWGSLGLVEVGSSAGPNDAVQRGDRFTAAFDVADSFNPRSTLVAVNRIDGVTRAVIAPTGAGPNPVFGASHVISGLAAIVNLAGDSNYLDKRAAALLVSFGEQGSDFAGGTRTSALLAFRHALDQAADYQRNAADFERNQHPGYDYSVADLQALGRVLTGEIPVVAAVDRASDIETLIRLARERSLRLIVIGGAEAWMVADELAAAEVPVIMAPTANLPSNFDRLNARRNAATLLVEAGVNVAFAGSQASTHNARNITQAAGNAIGEGLDREAALRAVTLAPAEIFGVADRLGSIEIGKEGDLVIWPADPFELTTYPDQVVIRGEAVSMQSRQTLLRDRYLENGERPPAFRRQ